MGMAKTCGRGDCQQDLNTGIARRYCSAPNCRGLYSESDERRRESDRAKHLQNHPAYARSERGRDLRGRTANVFGRIKNGRYS